MQVTVTNEGAVTIVRPVGPLITGELDDLHEQMMRLEQNWVKRVVMNMSDVPFVDSAGLELMCQFHERWRQRGLDMKFCSPGELARKAMDLTGLSGRFEIFGDSAGAIRSFL